MAPRANLSQETVKALHVRYLDGGSVTALATEAGCSPGNLYGRWTKLGLKRLPLGVGQLIPADDERARRAIELWDSGVGLKDAARQLKMGNETVRRLLVQAGRDPASRCSGEHHHSWRGGRLQHRNGYVLVRVHASTPLAVYADGRRYVMEHRLVMAQSVGRPLRKDETVHHINGVRDDNRLENLQLRSSDHGPGATWRCADCGSTRVEPAPLADA